MRPRTAQPGVLLECPTCGTPYEQGEEACFTCHLPLPASSHRFAGTSAEQRWRAARIATIGTPIVYGAAFIWFIVSHGPLWSRYDFGSGRDPISTTEVLILFGAGLVTYGTPGRTLHHYPSWALIRRGVPRWWKGLAASAVLVVSAVGGLELILRPALEHRVRGSIVHSATELAAAVDTWIWTTYLAVAVVLLWNLAATVLLPTQSLTPWRRQQLVKQQQHEHHHPARR